MWRSGLVVPWPVRRQQPSCGSAKGAERIFEAPRPSGDWPLPQGFRLAIALTTLPRAGFPECRRRGARNARMARSHLAATFSPDGRFLITAIRSRPCTAGACRPQGHADARLRVSRSLPRLTRDGKCMASSRDALILWPFPGQIRARWARTPKLVFLFLGRRGAGREVACHPTDDMSRSATLMGLLRSFGPRRGGIRPEAGFLVRSLRSPGAKTQAARVRDEDGYAVIVDRR